MMYLSVCATLLTMIGTMHLLAKTNKEAPGSFFKWVSCAVPGVAPLVSNFNGMKRYIFLACLFLSGWQSYAQYPLAKGEKQLNAGFGFSSWGIPVYVGLDYGVHKDISVGGEFSFRSYSDHFKGISYSHTIIAVGANGNYHFNRILKIPKDWDAYAGLNLGFYSWSSPNGYNGGGNSGIGMGAQFGGRYYFNTKFAVNLELGGGTASGGKIGMTMKF